VDVAVAVASRDKWWIKIIYIAAAAVHSCRQFPRKCMKGTGQDRDNKPFVKINMRQL
jgi:hypothetical protein